MKKRPPRLAQRFFSWYCRNSLHDPILGDLEEQFYQNQAKYGTRKAKLRFWVGVILFINRYTLKREHRSPINKLLSMSTIKNNIISSIRFFRKNRGFTAINIFGLTLGLSSFLLILFFVNHQLSFDQFLENKDQIYRVNFAFQDNAGNVTTLVNSPPALAPGIRGNFSELEKISRSRYAMNCLFSNGDVHFYEDHGYYADSLFLEILQYEMLSGDPSTALDQPNSIVISEELALKYFNDPDPVGQSILFNNTLPLNITGVLADIPENSHLNFNFLISFSTYTIPEGYASDLTSWSWLGFMTYVKLKPNTDSNRFEDGLAQHFRDLNPEDPTPMQPIVQNVTDIYLGSSDMSDDLASHIRSGNRFSVTALLIVALLILIIAGFNFSNLSHALSINRTKSTGVRKVLGANRKGIVAQLLTESMILSFLCLLLSFGIILVIFPSVARFMMWEFELGMKQVIRVLPILIFVGIFIGLASGIYPALSLSKIDVIKSLKGNLKNGKQHPLQLKNVLLTLQFAISIGLICATIIMAKQINFLINKDTGYSADNVVLIKTLPEDMTRYFETYKGRLTQHSSVAQVSRSERVVGDPWPFSIIQKVGDDPENSKRVFFNLADYGYFETMSIPLISGRSFSRDFINDPTKAIIINQKAADELGLEDPVGQQVHFFELDGPRTIIGVAEDFNYTSLHQEIGPAVVIMPFIDMEYMYVRFNPGNPRGQIALLEDTWQQVAGGTPLEWKFLDANLERLYQSEEKLSSMIQIFSILAILLACLGLYGMVTFMVNKRIKEVGVRKVLGASVSSLYMLFIKTYFYQTLLALILIVPLIHYLINNWLDNFAYHIQIAWWIYPMAGLLLMVLIMATVTFQIMKAVRVNPTKLLRDE